ncbi:MAG: clostripain-related cysteine peptidase [Myxococcales bacterium]
METAHWSCRRAVVATIALLAAAACDPPPIEPIPLDAGTPTCPAHAFLTKEKTCQCLLGYTGAHCEKCVSGSAMSDAGECAPPPSCMTHGEDYCGHGKCEAGSPPECVCNAGYVGERCDACADGFHKDAAGVCSPIPDCTKSAWRCYHGSCNGGSPGKCQCETGWEGDRCERCAGGYRLVDGSCLHEDCATLNVLCDGHGTCSDTEQGVSCTCDDGFVTLDEEHCVPAHGASCADPQVLDLAVGFLESSMLGTGPMPASKCLSATGVSTKTRVVRFSLPTAQKVRIGLQQNGMLVATLAEGCSTTAAGSQCAWATVDSPLEADLAAGDHFLLVQSFTADLASSFTVQASVVCAKPGEVFAWGLQRCVADPCAANPCQQENQHVCAFQPDGTAACGCDVGFAATGPGEACVPAANPDSSRCETALPLAAARGQSVVVSGAAAAGLTQDVGSCEGLKDGGTLYFGLLLEQRSRVRFYVAAPAGLAVSVRRRCEIKTSELLCQGDISTFSLGGGPALTGGVLEAGDYAVLVHGVARSDSVRLDYTVQPDPCAALSCAGGQEPEPSVDWSACACACPWGEVFDGAACVADACEPNPCTGDATRCVLDGSLAATCQCPIGTLPGSAAGSCEPDPAAAEWTVLVYESLDNNLGVYGGTGFNRLSVKASDPVEVVWLSALPKNDATLYHVGHGHPAETLARWDAPDMGSWRTLRDFAALAESYPARHYALALANHGGGLDFSWDSGYAETFISISDGGYARALAPVVRRLGIKLDVVDFEMCLMARWEVAEATRPFARSMLGSPQESYDLYAGIWADTVAKDPTLPLAQLGRAVADLHTSEIETFVDLDAAGAITQRLGALSEAMRARLDLCPTYDSLEKGCYPYSLGGGDLGGFCRALAADATLPQDLRDAATATADALAAAVHLNRAGTGGLGIYLPELSLPASATPAERALASDWSGPGAVWLSSTTWDELLTECRQR